MSRRSAAWMRHAQAAWAVPFVMTQRMARMMQPAPSARDRAELQRMVTEKYVAMHEAWAAMASEALRFQFRLARSWWTASWWMLESGVAPLQRRAIRNARRLAR